MTENKIKIHKIFNDSQDADGVVYTYGIVFNYKKIYFTCLANPNEMNFFSFENGMGINTMTILIDAYTVKVNDKTDTVYIMTNYALDNAEDIIYENIFFKSLDKYHYGIRHSIKDGALTIKNIKITKKGTVNLKKNIPYKVIITSKKLESMNSSMMVFIKSINGKEYKQKQSTVKNNKTKKWYEFWKN